MTVANFLQRAVVSKSKAKPLMVWLVWLLEGAESYKGKGKKCPTLDQGSRAYCQVVEWLEWVVEKDFEEALGTDPIEALIIQAPSHSVEGFSLLIVNVR